MRTAAEIFVASAIGAGLVVVMGAFARGMYELARLGWTFFG
jgi:hypothetical protein